MSDTSNPHRRQIIKDLCQKFPKASNGSLARSLHEKHPGHFPTLNAADTAVRWHRGNRGGVSRKTAELRGTAKPKGELPSLPDSLSRPLIPFVLETRRLLVLSDIHCPFQDNAALEAALDHADKFRPDTILFNGDSIDFEGCSRFARDPRGPTTKVELQMFSEVLGYVRARQPRAKKKFRRGNHEERWEHMLWLNPHILDIAEFAWEKWAGLQENRVEVIRTRGPVMAGKLPIWHGHEKGKQLSAPVNQARGMFLRYVSSALEGHGHRTSQHVEPTADGRKIACHSTGCLCGLWPEYARINKWDHGFATVEVAKDGTYEVQLKRIIDGRVY